MPESTQTYAARLSAAPVADENAGFVIDPLLAVVGGTRPDG